MRRSVFGGVAVVLGLALTASACGREEEGGSAALEGECKGQQTTGITDKSLKLGGIYPKSGPASAYGIIPDGIKAYFDYVNKEKGGIKGRQVEFLVRDDGYQPPKTVEEAKRLVEQEKVFALFQTLGTPPTTATWDYAAQKQVPQVFVGTGASRWGSDKKHPWTIGWQPDYVSEARVYAKYVKENKPKAKVAVLFQNDDFGKDVLNGFKKGTEGSEIKVVAEESYEVTDPTIQAQFGKLAKSGADVFLNVATPKFAAQALGADAKVTAWNPLHILANVSASPAILKQVGFPNVQNIVSAGYLKDASDPQWANDAGMKLFREKLSKYAPSADPANSFYAYGWAVADSFAKTLESAKCTTREGLRDAARNLKNMQIDMLLPGITLNTGADDGFPIESMQVMKFKGERWNLEGAVIDTRKEFGPVGG